MKKQIGMVTACILAITIILAVILGKAPSKSDPVTASPFPSETLVSEATAVATDEVRAEFTSSPIAEVTEAVSEAPTEKSTEALTAEPTEHPTAASTDEPTKVFTAEPTEPPAETPTAEPTVKPTEAPAAEPTEHPTEAASAEPTEKVTEKPTEAPTAEPTEKPTVAPTAEPTEKPTEAPTPEPTESPTEAPTAEPTEKPTVAPTAVPATEVPYDSSLSTEIFLSDNGTSVSNNNGFVSIQNGDVYVTGAGEYDIYGTLTDNSIIVEAPETDKVYLNLRGVTISSALYHPIYIASADKVEISSKNGTVNYIYDNRTTDDMSTALGAAIYAKCDLELKGKGTLCIESDYNNGVATKDDLTVKNLTLSVTAPNNALKGNDSVTIESGTLTLVSTQGDGIKTESTDVSSSGKQRGIITISGGTVNIHAAGKALNASYDVLIAGGVVNEY